MSSPVDRPPEPAAGLSIAGLASALDRLLPFWFLLWSAIRLGALQGFAGLDAMPGLDFRIYRAGGLAVLEGRDPWTSAIAFGRDLHFAALPSAAQLFVPFALIPEVPGLVLFVAASLAVLAVALRRLGLPLWWLLFPPVIEGLAAANPQVLVFGLLAIGAPEIRRPAIAAGRAVAVALKVYAIVPIVAAREWRALAVVGGAFAVSFAVAPGLWLAYASQFSAIAARLMDEAHGGVSAMAFLVPTSALAAPLGIPPVVGLAIVAAAALLILAVALRDVRAAGWLTVPLLWPASEYHYGMFALPVARRLGILIVAMGMPWATVAGLVVMALEVIARRPSLARQAEPPIGLVDWLRTLPVLHR